MSLQDLYGFLVLLHESIDEFLQIFMNINDESYDVSTQISHNYLEEDHRGTYMNYGYHLD
jgi:hypothetical protein